MKRNELYANKLAERTGNGKTSAEVEAESDVEAEVAVEEKPDSSLYDDNTSFLNNPDDRKQFEVIEGLGDIDNAKKVLAEKERLEQELDEVKQEAEEIKQEIAVIKEKAIVPQDDATLGHGRVKMGATGVVDTSSLEEVSEHEVIETLRTLRKVNEAVQWVVGDLINHAFYKWGEKYAYYARETGFAEKTLREYAYVARSVSLSIRMDNLSFGHHQLVAGFKDKDGNILDKKQKEWLDKAVKGDGEQDSDGKAKVWSVARLRKEIIIDKRGGKIIPKANEATKNHIKTVRTLSKLLATDVASIPQEKRLEHLDDLEKVRKFLNTVEEKLKETSQQSKAK